MTALTTEPTTSGARRAEQVTVLLDEEAHILSVNTGLAGSSFLGLAEHGRSGLHAQFHPGCGGDCQFYRLWKIAWRDLQASDTVEWEIDDPVLGKLLRINLARPPSAREAQDERRRGFALLTITDITRHRREYESLVRRERSLAKLLIERGIDPATTPDGKPSVSRPDDARFTRTYRSLNRLAIVAQETERRRIATELHDSLAQSASVIKYNIEAAMEQLARRQPDVDVRPLENAVDQMRELIEEIRRISNNLAPSMLEDFGLCAALRALCSQYRSSICQLLPVCDTCIDESRVPDVVRFTIYRVAQEALNNIAKHAEASEARLDLRMDDGSLVLSVRDNGKGYSLAGSPEPAAESREGTGLRNMRERVMAAGGEFAIESAPGQGVSVLASWTASSLELLREESVLYGVDGHG